MRCFLVCLVALCLPWFSWGRDDDETYYVAAFSCSTELNAPAHAHSFAVFIRAVGPQDDVRLISHTISWLPATLEIKVTNEAEKGVNLGVHETLKWASAKEGVRLSQWGPVQIHPDLYRRALKQQQRLESTVVAYKVADGGLRPDKAINCIHALSDLITEDGFLATGTERGEAATARIIEHWKPWLIRPDKTYDWISERLGTDQYRTTKRGIK